MGEAKRRLTNPGDHDVKKWILGKFTVEMFPEGYILLNQELATGYHPQLEKNLGNYPVDEIDIRLATIATYCGIIMDGAYTIQSRSELCAILAGRLFHLREYAAATRIRPIEVVEDFSKFLGNVESVSKDNQEKSDGTSES